MQDAPSKPSIVTSYFAIRVTSYMESIISAIFAARKLRLCRAIGTTVWFTTAYAGMRQKMTESSSFEFVRDSIAIVGKSPACCSSFASNDSAVLRENNRTTVRNLIVTARVEERNGARGSAHSRPPYLISFSVHDYSVLERKIISSDAFKYFEDRIWNGLYAYCICYKIISSK